MADVEERCRIVTDTYDKETRSRIMARVLSKGTKPELAVSAALKAKGLRLRTNGARVVGNPDFASRKLKLAVFVNGCFWHWHGCPRCRMPKSNRKYWEGKIARNVERDRKYRRELRRLGWRYVTIWECDLPAGIARAVRTAKLLRSLY